MYSNEYLRNNIPYWDIACTLDVQRESPKMGEHSIYPMGPIDPGIKFFVLALEELGATTHYSCEGHPYGAYVSFTCTAKVAKEIHFTSTFMCMADTQNKRLDDIVDCAMYARSRTFMDIEEHAKYVESYTEEMRVAFLRASTETWLYQFGRRLDKLRKRLEDLSEDFIRDHTPQPHGQ